MLPVKSILHDFSHLFFPHVCAGCGNDNIHVESPLCANCIHALPLTNFHLYDGNPVEKYFWGRIPVHAATACCHFTEGSLVQHLLHQVKYRSNKELGFFLGRMMGNLLVTADRFSGLDVLVPLPLFASRQKKRGFNQAEILCLGMADKMKLPVVTGAVTRTMATETQTTKNRIGRWANMQGKFELLQPAALAGKHVLLVDDVITTGATLEACGEQLLKAEGIKLSIAALAYTV